MALKMLGLRRTNAGTEVQVGGVIQNSMTVLIYVGPSQRPAIRPGGKLSWQVV